MDLHLLAQTAHAMEASGDTIRGPPAPHLQQQPTMSGITSYGPGMTSELVGVSGDGFRVPSMARSSENSGLGPNKQHKHRAAEQRRRERINEKLAQLRELVPHDQRSNTATFLEGVIAYVQSLQQSNLSLEAELAGLRHKQQLLHQQGHMHRSGVGTAAALPPVGQAQQPQQDVYLEADNAADVAAHIAQPCLSGISTAGAAMTAGLASTPTHSSSPPCNGAEAQMPTTSVSHSAALAAAPPFPAGVQQASLSSDARQALSNCNISPPELSWPAISGTTAGAASLRRALGSSPTPPPAALTPSPTDVLPPAAMPVSVCNPPPAAAPAGAAVQVQLQPTELQTVLEKALLTALQQQAQQLATQLSKQ